MGLFDLFKSKEEDNRQPVKTYSFRATGMRHLCRFPSGRFRDRQRQFVLDMCKNGEAVWLKEFEWEGEPAIAIMHKKFDTDIGVVPADQVQRILPLMRKYDITGKIIEMERIERGDDYKNWFKVYSVELNLFER